MQTSIGQLIAILYDSFERQYHDRELAAFATDVVVNEVLAASSKPARRSAPRNHHRRASLRRAA